MAQYMALLNNTVPHICRGLYFLCVLSQVQSNFLVALGLHCCAWAFSSCGERASHGGGFSCCGARALGAWASVVVAHGLSSCDLQALECRLGSCGAQA